jgi:RNA-directed DNA polymerase
MDRLAKRIADKRVLRLIRRYLQAGILAHGVHSERVEGTPQGGPLSPLLATCCSTKWIGSWSGADTSSCATRTTATSMSGAARRASGCCRRCAAATRSWR